MTLISAIVVLISVLGIVARRLLWRAMRAIPGSPRELAPAELAYIMRDGDMPHTLVVMSVDLIHRQIKTGDHELSPPLRSYEKQVWVSVKDFMKGLAHEKAGHLVPVDDIKNPVKWAMRAGALKKFIGETLHGIVQDIVEDPRHIKKYFSMTGIARLAFHFYTSNVRQAVHRELTEELLRDGFLVPEARRRRFATAGALLIPLAVALEFIASYFIPQSVAMPLLGATLLQGLLNGVVLRLVLELPGFIPTYEEFAKVASELNRGGARLAIIRNVLKGGKFILAAVLVIVSVILIATESIAVGFLFHQSAALLILAQTVLGFTVVVNAVDCYSIAVRQQPSNVALKEAKDIRSGLARIRPLDTFRSVLSDPNYDVTLSQLVAVYGIETLWLLS